MRRLRPAGDLTVDLAYRAMAESDELFMFLAPDGVCRWVNGGADVLGYRPDELVGVQALDLIHPDQLERALEAMTVQVDAGEYELVNSSVFRIRSRDGEYLECEVSAWPVAGDGETELLAVHVRPSVDARMLWRLLNDLLVGAEPGDALGRMLDLVFERGTFTRLTVELNDQDERRIVGSTLPDVLLGVGPDGSSLSPWSEVRVTGQAVRLDSRDELAPTVAAAAVEAGLGALWVIPVHGETEVEGLITMWVVDGGPPIAVNGYLADTLQPLSALVLRWRTQQHQLVHAANIDPLTGCPNRRMVMQELERLVSASLGDGDPLAVLFLDLDYFKSVNDVHGHAAGDAVLVETARRMRARFRGADMVGRIGGDEFVVLVPHPPDDLARLAKRLVKSLSEEMVIDGRAVRVGVSIGLALMEQGDTADVLLSRADEALFQSKRLGRGIVTEAPGPLVTRGHEPVAGQAPTGDARQRLIETAADLLSRVGPTAITASVVSQSAQVSLEELGRQFPSMRDLHRAGMVRIAEGHFSDVKQALDSGASPVSPLQHSPGYWRAVLRCAMDGEIELSASEVDAGVSVPLWFLGLAPAEEASDLRVRIATLMALEFGWLAMGETIRSIVGQPTGDEYEEMVTTLRSQLLGQVPTSLIGLMPDVVGEQSA